MRRVISYFWRAWSVIARRSYFLVRRLDLRMRYPNVEWPSDMEMERGSCISITDGGTIRLAGGLHLGRGSDIVVKYGSLSIGANCFIGRGSTVVCRDSIVIGADALIAEYVTIRDQDHDYDTEQASKPARFLTAGVVIGDKVWIGAKATVTRGVTIGDHVVVGANAVVTRNVPTGATVAGVPARVIKTRQT